MSSENRDAAIRITLGYEGGYTNNPADPGGPTNYGITIVDARKYWKADATAEDIKGMPIGVAIDIYKKRYWAAMDCDADPAGVDFATFDYGVNSGIGRAVPVRARTENADRVAWVKAICAERIAFLHRLRTWTVFGRGWSRRVADVEARGVKMALMAAKASDVAGELAKHGDDAAKQSQKEAAKVGATVAAPGSTQIPGASHHVDIGTVPHWLLSLLGMIIAVALVVFVYRYWVNRQRANAYAAVARES